MIHVQCNHHICLLFNAIIIHIKCQFCIEQTLVKDFCMPSFIKKIVIFIFRKSSVIYFANFVTLGFKIGGNGFMKPYTFLSVSSSPSELNALNDLLSVDIILVIKLFE